MALIIDAKQNFGKDMKGDTKFATEYLQEGGTTDFEYIIEHSIKFMKLLNDAIVNKGPRFNTCNRVTYRGVINKVFLDTEKGECYRIITWSAILT